MDKFEIANSPSNQKPKILHILRSSESIFQNRNSIRRSNLLILLLFRNSLSAHYTSRPSSFGQWVKGSKLTAFVLYFGRPSPSFHVWSFVHINLRIESETELILPHIKYTHPHVDEIPGKLALKEIG